MLLLCGELKNGRSQNLYSLRKAIELIKPTGLKVLVPVIFVGGLSP